jgi:hypothetical protein
VKIRTEKKSLEMRAILGKNLKEPPICVFVYLTVASILTYPRFFTLKNHVIALTSYWWCKENKDKDRKAASNASNEDIHRSSISFID